MKSFVVVHSLLDIIFIRVQIFLFQIPLLRTLFHNGIFFFYVKFYYLTLLSRMTHFIGVSFRGVVTACPPFMPPASLKLARATTDKTLSQLARATMSN